MPDGTPESLRLIAQRVAADGGRALLVGGCVRDLIVGVQPKDYDVEMFGVSDAGFEAMATEIGLCVRRVGKAFPVWKMWDESLGGQAGAVDVSIPSSDSDDPRGSVTDVESAFAAAALRRDFTINAMAWDVLSGEVLDPHGGKRDLRDRCLRQVSARFGDDPLRVLRGMQFCGRFELTADESTVAECQKLTPDGIPAERLFGEWSKLILKSKRPSLGLRFLRQTGWDRYVPEIASLVGVPQDPEWHPEGDAWVHTGCCLDAFAATRVGNEREDLTVGLAVLCHDFGKATHTQFHDGRWRSHGHEAAGEEPTRAFLGRITDQTDLINEVVGLVTHHMVPRQLFREAKASNSLNACDRSIRRLARTVRLDRLARVSWCDKAGRPPLPPTSDATDWLCEKARALDVLSSRPKPLLMGRDLISLGMSPGPEFRHVLESAFEAQLNGAITDHASAIAFAKQWGRQAAAPVGSIADLQGIQARLMKAVGDHRDVASPMV